jgi:hypothetical protein
MSHHLDSPLARQDVRLDITDLYVFRGTEGTVFVVNVNSSLAGPDAPQGFHPEAQYLIKIDLDGTAVEGLAYRCTFGERDAGGQQTVELRRLAGRDAQDPTAIGTVLAQGETGTTMMGIGGLRLWAGRVLDPFYIDPTVLAAVRSAFKAGTRIDRSGWQQGRAVNLCADATINAIVLEVPDAELTWRLREVPEVATNGDFTWRFRPQKRINVWAATVLLTDDGRWQPINRAGHPLIHAVFNPDNSEAASNYNCTAPADDLANYGERFAHEVAAVVAAEGTAADPAAYGEIVVARLLPDMLPYQIGTVASYSFAGHNGRALTDNVSDVMCSLVTNSACVGGLSRGHMNGTLRDTFPYLAVVGMVG